MALVSTATVDIKVRVPGFTPQGGSAGGDVQFSGTTGAEKTTWGSLSRMQEVLESTSLGEDKRTRVRQGLQDIEPVDVSFYYQSGGGATTGAAAAMSTDAAANVTRAFSYAYTSSNNLTSVHTYVSGHTVTITWIVQKQTIDTEVGENVMVTYHLMPTGVWTFQA